MSLKCRLLPVLFATIALVGSTAASASENEPIFLTSQGRLVIPHLRLGNEIYYVILNRTPAPGYNFNLAGATVTKITPQPGDDWATAAELVGDWVFPELPDARLGIFASGSYSIFTPAEDDCPAGAETGTWTMDEETGVFFATAVTDANADCGLSHPDGPLRVKRVGSNLEILVHEEGDNGQQQVISLALQPG